MRNHILLLMLIYVCAGCAQGSKSSGKTPKEPVFLGLNGKLRTVEVHHFTEPDNLMRIEVYHFDDNGLLLERLGYYDPAKKVLTEKDTYKRDEEGDLMEEYKGFNLNDNHYIGESLWRRTEKEGNKQRWEKIDDSWWGSSYREIEYEGDKKMVYEYVIQKKNGETSNKTNTTEVLNSRGQTISVTKYAADNSPEYITTYVYNDHGHLLKEESEHIRKDGTSSKTVREYTIHEVDDRNNPLQISDENGYKKVYTYTYID